MASANVAPAIGIDLGTTFSCVAVLTEQGVKVIRNSEDSSTIPSVVAFLENSRLVGERAKERALLEPENTIYNMKRLIGRRLADEHVKKDLDTFPFKVVDDGHGNPKVQVKYQKKDILLRPEEISAAVLAELKAMAEEFLKLPVKDAVITVPAYFTNAQRAATLDAGRIAGLNVLETINEPTAAALAYGFDMQNDTQSRKVLIYDFGGGTFDVSVLNVTSGQVEAISSDGNGHLGGEDIDNLLVEYFASEFLQQNDIDLLSRARSSNQTESRDAKNAKKAVRRLRSCCEKAKIKLSSERETSFEIASLLDGKDMHVKMTRRFFESKCQDLIRSTLSTVMKTIESANLRPKDITDIILVGGSTRIPLVTEILQEIFTQKDICDSINPDEAVAYGAAVKAALVSGVEFESVRKMRLRDVTPISLGIESYGGIMATLIKRNTPIPVRRKKVFTTGRDNQTQIRIKVYEGERHITQFNNFLGEFTLVGIPPAPKKIPQIEVAFEVDNSGLLKVRATDLGSEWVNGIQVTNNRGRLTAQEIERAIQTAAQMREKDLEYVRKVNAREKLETYANQIEQSIRNPRIREQMDNEILQAVSEIVDQSIRFCSQDQDSDEKDYEEKYSELWSIWVPEVTRYFQGSNGENLDVPVLESLGTFYRSSDA